MTDWSKVQWGRVRKKVDHHFRALGDDLKQAFNGPYDQDGKYTLERGWRNGEASRTFEGKTLAQWAAEFRLDGRDNATAESVFQRLYGDIWHLHLLAIHEQNQKEPIEDRYDKSEYDQMVIDGKWPAPTVSATH